ncbi:RICIN domain-containing protein [Dactylosporangium sp. AC04546]|uniref:RICIN domain-containing protein n=1 Tax=Dactylosporangium sp. AC04546 TaxID=2862460 RepID=UPI001EDF8498|nr:RICIN domain-containing protein [Dactylosporangium sp. AC04546]WVK83543.1 RICIN domain-containing protein [Dactylosporangium sp. AC04546]
MKIRTRLIVTLAAAAAILFGGAGVASADTIGMAVRLQPPRVVTITQGSGPLFLDAHEIASRDFNVVTRPFQNNTTQQWLLTDVGGGLYTIQQVSSARYLDAHEIAELDFRVVTRPQQNNSTQLWRLYDYGGAFYMIQQVSSGRYLDAYISSAQDFQAVTRPFTGANSQVWRIL